jgi:hypothetical protein
MWDRISEPPQGMAFHLYSDELVFSGGKFTLTRTQIRGLELRD